MSLRLEANPAGHRQLDKLPARIRAGLVHAMQVIAADPDGHGLDVKPLRAIQHRPPVLRLRVGDHRVLFQIDREAGWVRVVRAGRRGAVYRGLDHLDP